jgi:hypothetical protein
VREPGELPYYRALAYAPPPPADPTDLAALPDAVSIELSWRDNSTSEDGFIIERQAEGQPYSRIATLAPNSTTYVDAKVSPHLEYRYRVRAFHAFGFSEYSGDAPAALAPAVDHLTVTPSTIARGHAVSIAWTSANQASFTVDFCQSSCARVASGSTATQVSWTVPADQPVGRYSLQVTILSEFGGSASASVPLEVAAVTIGDVTVNPVNPQAGATAFIGWTSANQQLWHVELCGASECSLLASDTTGATSFDWAVPLSQPPGLYSVKVTAFAGPSPSDPAAHAYSPQIAVRTVTIGFSVSGITVAEATGTAEAEAVLTTSDGQPLTSPVTAGYATADGTARAGKDYSPASGTLSFPVAFPSGRARRIPVAILDDSRYEPAESFDLTLSGGVGAFLGPALVVTISDDDPVPALSIQDVSVAESGGSALVTVTLSPTSDYPASARYATLGCSAEAGSDYESSEGTLAFAPGDDVREVRIPILQDLRFEGSEIFEVALSTPVNSRIADGLARVTIKDDDPPPGTRPTPRADFNADGQTDLLLQQPTSGNLVVWFMDGTVRTGGVALTPGRVDPSWTVAGVADFDGDDKPDILLRHEFGDLVVWFMDGTVRTGGVALAPSRADPSWTVAGVADLDGDGKPDIVFQNQAGDLVAWFMDGTVKLYGAAFTPSRAAASWRIAGVADFDADGKPDLLFRHLETGDLVVWFMDGVVKTGGAALLPGRADVAWSLAGVADLNGDDRPDLLWQQRETGDLVAWFMDGATRSCGDALTPSRVDPSWTVVGLR